MHALPCRQCGTMLAVPDELIGSWIGCPDCGNQFVAADAASAATLVPFDSLAFFAFSTGGSHSRFLLANTTILTWARPFFTGTRKPSVK